MKHYLKRLEEAVKQNWDRPSLCNYRGESFTFAQMAEQMKPEALKRIQNSLVLEAIAKAENIEVPEEKLDAEIEKMAKAYGQGTGFGFGILFLKPIFYMILGFGDSEYIGPQ